MNMKSLNCSANAVEIVISIELHVTRFAYALVNSPVRRFFFSLAAFESFRLQYLCAILDMSYDSPEGDQTKRELYRRRNDFAKNEVIIKACRERNPNEWLFSFVFYFFSA